MRSELGVGSTFTVLLPVHWNAAMAGGSARVVPVVVSGRTAMIVDDDEGFRTALRGMLQGLSQRVSEASGGEEALAMMAADRPDVVFLDLRMPDLGGAEVLARMGAETHLRDVPVVIVTSVDLGIDVPANLGRCPHAAGQGRGDPRSGDGCARWTRRGGHVVSVPAEVQGRLVLLVDDNETTRYVFGRWLSRAGFEVIEASTGAEALDILATTMPELAVLDVNLPDASGFDLLEHIKERDASVPVVHVSATFIETTDRSAGLQRGADAYLVEPVEREELLATVVALLRYSTARRAAERLSTQLTTLHAGSVDMHGASTVEELTAVSARTAARLLARRVALAVYAESTGTIALAELSGALTQAPYRPGALLESAGPGVAVRSGVITSTVMAPFAPSADLRADLGAHGGVCGRGHHHPAPARHGRGRPARRGRHE